MANRIEVNNHAEAWNIVNEIFPTDYEKDEEASQRAGYPTYRSTVEYYDYICDLNDRLEINLKDGRTINVWITGEYKDEVIAALKAKVEQLNAALDKELEWKDDIESGTRMDQTDYEKLASTPDTDVLSAEQAKDLIFKEFGFSQEKVEIISKANTFEVNRHSMMRVKQTYARDPLYNSTDWNYIRFECAGWDYEMINGQLYQYCS